MDFKLNHQRYPVTQQITEACVAAHLPDPAGVAGARQSKTYDSAISCPGSAHGRNAAKLNLYSSSFQMNSVSAYQQRPPDLPSDTMVPSPTSRSLTEEDRFSIGQLSAAELTRGLQDSLEFYQAAMSTTLERLLPLFEKTLDYMWASYHHTIYHHLVEARHAHVLLSDVNKDIITDDGLRFGADILDHLKCVLTPLLNGIPNSDEEHDFSRAVLESDALVNDDPRELFHDRIRYWEDYGKEIAFDVCGLRLLASIGTLPSLESELQNQALRDAIEVQCFRYMRLEKEVRDAVADHQEIMIAYAHKDFAELTDATAQDDECSEPASNEDSWNQLPISFPGARGLVLTIELEKKWFRQYKPGMGRHDVSAKELPSEAQAPAAPRTALPPPPSPRRDVYQQGGPLFQLADVATIEYVRLTDSASAPPDTSNGEQLREGGGGKRACDENDNLATEGEENFKRV
ncbi:uncharacterized protein PAC_15171 [Phialocephala subalpina]|uniref:Uncharacterized protein n=1 Tax=Phialocephala subalpina TaxID=576137 RepID=A0A1L7XJQ0_9HELO|nr:uncharacterized protein PAC_15171 [Phialocephala subalpina]